MNNDCKKKYDEKLTSFWRSTASYQYIFEVTKCCGYGEWITVSKDESLSRLYDNVTYKMDGLKPKGLYAYSLDNGDCLVIPDDKDVTCRTFLQKNVEHFRPIYPLPSMVVYKIYYDDGYCHKERSSSLCEENSCMIDNCILHR